MEDRQHGTRTETERELPLTIDSSRPYPEGPDPRAGAGRHNYLGGLDWTREAQAYFGPMTTRSVAYVRLLRVEWWRDEYLLRRVAAALGPRNLAAVLMWRRDGVAYWTVMRRFGVHDADRRAWLDRLDRRARQAARAALGPELTPVDWDDAGDPKGV